MSAAGAPAGNPAAPPPGRQEGCDAERAARPLLADTLRVLLPPTAHTALLRAVLLDGSDARDAWTAWRNGVGDVRRFFAEETLGLKRLVPLLAAALERSRVPLDPELHSYLRTARVHEELRAQRFDPIARDALNALADAGVGTIALKGVALKADAYPAWALRHSHDVDVLVARADLARAATVLTGRGLTRQVARTGHLEFRTVPQLPVHLHGEPFRLACFVPPLAEWWVRSRAVSGIRVLDPADALLHVCGQAACSPGRTALQWACDAWFLIAHHPHLEWQTVCATAAAARLALPVFVLLEYVAEQLGAAVPPHALDRLRAAAAGADRVAREAALVGAHTGRDGRYDDLLRASRTWTSRAFVARWIALPSPALLRACGVIWSDAQLPVFYARRALRFARRWRQRL